MTRIKTRSHLIGYVVILVLTADNGAVRHANGNEGGQSGLPEARGGIAAKYPGDRGIENDRSIVFFEDFNAESVEAIAERWESVQNKEILSLSSDVPEESGDGNALLMTHVGGKGTGAHLYRRLQPGYEKLYIRFYVKFDRECAPIHHFFHVGGYNPATAWPQGGAGQRPRGDKRFRDRQEISWTIWGPSVPHIWSRPIERNHRRSCPTSRISRLR
ncbi:MAG: hypothetical protein IH892_12385, partial [Planctomycetes bacterium]|nr:hypothetical protein [Planctomycetota bacterium]